MNNFGSSILNVNRSNTNRTNMNSVMNPFIRYYPVDDHNAVKVDARSQGKTTSVSFQESRMSGTGADAAATDTVGMDGMAVEDRVADVVVKTGVSAGTRVTGQIKHEACPTDSEFKLDFTGKGLLNGIVMAEVLGRPKYFRKGR